MSKTEPKPRRNSRASFKLIDVPPYPTLLASIERALKDVEEGKYKLRDLALISVLTFTGCRLGEALQITRSDIDKKNETVRIRQLKKKSEAYRVVPVPSTLFWSIIERYLNRLVNNKLFEITDRQARNIVYKFSKRYLKKKIRPHAIRHSYAIQILKTTKNLEVVRRLLGHSDYKHLKHYLDYTQEDLREELKKALSEF